MSLSCLYNHPIRYDPTANTISYLFSTSHMCEEKSIFKLFLQIVKSSLVITPNDFVIPLRKKNLSHDEEEEKEFSTFFTSNICLELLLTSLIFCEKLTKFIDISLFFLKVQKKRRIVARVQCRNIKNECPKPTCDEPILLPGKCCKTCPGDSHSKFIRRGPTLNETAT